MPHSVSARKRVRQNLTHRLRNRRAKSALRTQVKKLRAALEGGDLEAARREFLAATRALDKAAVHGVIHKNAAARNKSRLATKLNRKAAAAKA